MRAQAAPLAAATLAFDADGIPFSPDYGDRYHPRSGPFAQAGHVFLQGNGLPGRWQGRSRFVVLETGFGLGNNFLATLDAWRSDARRCERLHFISIEKHPLALADLARVHAASPLPHLAGALLRAWPPLTSGMHSLAFDDDRVQLLLAFGDVADRLPEIVARVDAFYLDGFAPDRNPAMWQPRLYKAMARLAAPGATAATWSAARPVRDGLAAAGFDVRRAPGSGGKREITLARFAPRFAPRHAPGRLAATAPPDDERHAIVVGTGLAGCAIAMALAEQGWSSTLIERLPAPAGATSGNRAGIFHGVVHPADGLHARFNRAAALHATAAVQTAIARHGAPGDVGGLLRLDDEATLAAMLTQIAALALPPDYVQALSAADASRLAGIALQRPAWHYPGGGWVSPSALAESFVQRAGGGAAALRTATHVAALYLNGARWQLMDAAGAPIAESATVVLANAADALRLLGTPGWPVQSVRGQTTELPLATPGLQLPRIPVSGDGYVLPPLPGAIALFGATAQPGDDDPALREADQRRNLARLTRLTGVALAGDAATAVAGRVGWRCVAIDRLPIIGGVPDRQLIAAGAGLRLDQARFVPRLPGLYVFTALASRGITWAALGARTLAALISASPCPVEASLLDAVDAGRFDSRAARRAPHPSSG